MVNDRYAAVHGVTKSQTRLSEWVNKESTCNAGDTGDVGKIPWRRAWQPSPVFLPGESHGQRSPVGYNQSMGLQRVGHDWSDWAQHETAQFCLLTSFLFPDPIRDPPLHLVMSPSSSQFSRSVMSDSLRPHEPQHTRPPCPSPTPGVYSNSCPWSQWCHPAISHLSSLSPPAPNPSQHQGLFQWVNSLHEVAKVLEFQLQHQSFQWTPRTYLLQDGLVGSPCNPRDSQESSPTPQFKSINFSVLSFLYSPTLTSIHDHWKTIALTRRIFVGKVMSLLFNMLSGLVITFLPRSVF